MIRSDTQLRFLKGVGPRRAAGLAKQDHETIEDLLYVLPFRYEDRRSFARLAEIEPADGNCTMSVEVRSSRLIRTRRRGFTIFEATVADDSGAISAVWFNQPYLARVLVAGKRVVLFASVGSNRFRKRVLENPEYEFLDEEDTEGIHTGRIVPVYRKLAEIPSRFMRTLIHRAFEEMDPASLPELLPEPVRRRHDLLARHTALRAVHFPPRDVPLEALQESRTPAQRTLAFEEIYLLQLALALRRQTVKQERRGASYEMTDALRTRLGRMLPFRLTGAQKRVVAEIGADLRSDHPMNRLLQGDVGSGKTIVALLTLLVAVENGYQGVMMAPTEILAEQHYRNIRDLIDRGNLDCRTTLLTGSLKAAPRRAALEAIATGVAQLVVGTHALFDGGVEFSRLGLAVIDEQHRFGVMQRAALTAKGVRPDVLVMTATPIPRSLALTLYGDLDLSTIDELPPGRTPVTTVVRAESERERVYRGLRGELEQGRQAYIVVPLVEETEKSDLKAAVAFADALREGALAGIAVGMIHGRLKGEEKDRVMRQFVAGEIRALVATTVIEVGVDVANASVMIIEHAERFGLSQLHQLRGRVGRGSERSYCVLMVGDEAHGKEARERLAVMAETTNGFRIAERDLALRGPGVIFGTQQHGLGDMRFLAEILGAPALLEAARSEAQAQVAAGTVEQARQTLASLNRKWRRRLALGNVG